jgi:hypothetical protein
MPKRPGKPEVIITPFSIVNQVTGPPFAHSLDIAELRKKLMKEMGGRGGLKSDEPRDAGLSKGERSKLTREAARARRQKANP